MTLNQYEQAIVRNADWFMSIEDADGFIRVPADEYYGIPGDASLIGHAISVRIYAWYLTKREDFLESATRSAQWLAQRQDESGGWHHDAGYSLDAAQCVMEGFASYERLTGDKSYHEVLVKAADRMISGTVDGEGNLLIGNLTECGEYVHHSFLAWRLTNLERHYQGGLAILEKITSQFNESEGYWNTVGDIHVPTWMEKSKNYLSPLIRCSMAKFDLKGKTIAQISEKLLPLALVGKGPQYTLGMMDAEGLLDTLDGRFALPELHRQTRLAVKWIHSYCRGPVAGSFCESRAVPMSEAVYPIRAINDSENAGLWPTAAVLLAYVGLQDYAEEAEKTAQWILSMQDEDGSFWTHQDKDGHRFGEKYGNINFYGSTGLWYYNWAMVKKELKPSLFPS